MDGLPDFGREQQASRELTASQRPNILTRCLMAVAGVDRDLSQRCPASEWKIMEYNGASLLWGACFTGLCVWVVLGELFASITMEARLTVTILVTGVRFTFDRKIVAADWYAQGLAYCWANGLTARPRLAKRVLRILSVSGRIAYSLAFSSLIALVVMTLVFDERIIRKQARDNLIENTAVLKEATLLYDRHLREGLEQVAKIEKAADVLEIERGSLIKPQLADQGRAARLEKLSAQLDALHEARAETQRSASRHLSDRNAERRGVQARANNTGEKGKGRWHDFHDDEAARLVADVAARDAEIVAVTAELGNLRREVQAEAGRQDTFRAGRLAVVDDLLRDAAATRHQLIAERAVMQADREAWIDRRMRQMPAYKPMPTGIGDRLLALNVLAAAHLWILLLMLVLELTMVALESAGPLGKTFFTPSTHYAMWLALRLEDATDEERRRRRS